jgi:RNA polymerase sigma factor (sigma-70 family)
MTHASVDSFFPSRTKGAANGVMMTPRSIAYRTGRRHLEGEICVEHSQPHSRAMTTRPASCGRSSPIESHLLDWQTTGDSNCLTLLVEMILPLAGQTAKSKLRRLGIHDPSAVDETISLLLDHLRRLPNSATHERTVARFVPRRDTSCACSLIDSGRAYIVWLTRERAADVARARRRRSRHTTVFSLLDTRMTSRLQESVASDDAICDGMTSQADLCLRLHDAIVRLPAPERLLIELLLEGKTQAAIAHVLDVCEGTVSRLRMRAIATLRDLMAE